jgi:hypothetical protein
VRRWPGDLPAPAATDGGARRRRPPRGVARRPAGGEAATPKLGRRVSRAAAVGGQIPRRAGVERRLASSAGQGAAGDARDRGWRRHG